MPNSEEFKTSQYAQLISRYTDQGAELPHNVKLHCSSLFNGEAIKLYAFIDLDSTLNLKESWIVLSESHIVLIECTEAKISNSTLLDLDNISSAELMMGISCSKICFYIKNGKMLVVRYSHRQKESMAAVHYTVQQRIENNGVSLDEPDFAYAKSVTHSIRVAQASVNPSKLTVVWRLLSYLRPYRKQLAMGMIAAVIMTLLTLVSPFITKYLVDGIYYPYVNKSMGHQQAMHIGTIIISVLIIIYLLRELSHWVRLRTMSIIGEYVARDIRQELYAHIQKLNMSFFSKKQTGSLISRVSHDTDRLWDFLAFGVVEVTLAIIMLIGLSIALLVLDWRLGLAVILPMPFILLSFRQHGYTLGKYFTRAWRKWSRITEVLSDTIPGIRVVKAFNQEKREKNRFDKHNENCVREFNQIHKVWTKFWPRILLAIHLIVVVVWWLALPRLVPAENSDVTALTIGTFLAFLMYLSMLYQPMETIGMLMRMLNRATSSANRVFEILDTEPEIKVAANPIVIDNLKGNVRFENVSFAYDAIKPVLKGVSFDVKAGEMIGLVGQSGAGKSTITNLLARFYLPNEGEIYIDDVDIRKASIGHLRQQMGMVLQDPFLFHGTILENIRYGNQEKSLDEVIEAAIAANSHDFICKLPYGYETIVGERGHTLSGGERQRVSIARAILTNPQILILDEATSSVDTETEHKIQDALDRLVEHRTVFAIAHRLSTLQKANRIFVLDKGRIVEQGDHKDLLENEDGIYHKLVKLQHEMQEQHFV